MMNALQAVFRFFVLVGVCGLLSGCGALDECKKVGELIDMITPLVVTVFILLMIALLLIIVLQIVKLAQPNNDKR